MPDRPSARFFAAVFVVAAFFFLASYWRSFRVQPAGDDFGYINEIHRGNRDGVAALFTKSVTGQTYRPLTSLGIWGMGRLFPDHPTVGIRVLHLASAVVYALVALLWVRAAGLGRGGSVAAIALMLLHPVLPQAVGSIDGFNSLLSSAMLWLGAWAVLVLRAHPLGALAGAAARFIVGVGFKEYAFAMVPLSMLVVLCFWRERRVGAAVMFLCILGLLLAASIFVRRYTIAPDQHGGWGYVSFAPGDLAAHVVSNAALFVVALLFFGNSVWAYVNESPTVMGIVAASVLAAGLMIAIGLRLRAREPRVVSSGFDGLDPVNSVRRWLVFLAVSFAAASFPMIVMTHVSEMYVPPLVLPLALLCGLAADGLVQVRPISRVLATCAGVAALGFSIMTIRAKVDGLVDVGQRAQRQIDQILSLLPPDARDQRVAIRFLDSDRRPRDLYAVFRMPDSLLLVHEIVLEWPRPDRGLVLDVEAVMNYSLVDGSKYDLTLGWDARQQKFLPLR